MVRSRRVGARLDTFARVGDGAVRSVAAWVPDALLRAAVAVRVAVVTSLAAAAFAGTAVSAQEAPAWPGSTPSAPTYGFSLATSDEVEVSARQQYDQLKYDARARRALAPDDYPALVRVRGISRRLITYAPRFNPRAQQWNWEINLIGSKTINAFCLPGGKIAVYTGLIDQLQLSDAEIAVVVGHEIAHALREHGREQLAKARAGQVFTTGASILSSLLGYGDIGGTLANGATKLTLLHYSRGDESEADAIGLELAARAGFDPHAGLSLWRKMDQASKGSPPQWLSTHPSNATRLADMERRIPEVMPLYDAALRGAR